MDSEKDIDSYSELKNKLDGLSGTEAQKAKRAAFKEVCSGSVGKYAYKQDKKGNRELAGSAAIESGLVKELRLIFKDLYDDELAYEIASREASQFY